MPLDFFFIIFLKASNLILNFFYAIAVSKFLLLFENEV